MLGIQKRTRLCAKAVVFNMQHWSPSNAKAVLGCAESLWQHSTCKHVVTSILCIQYAACREIVQTIGLPCARNQRDSCSAHMSFKEWMQSFSKNCCQKYGIYRILWKTDFQPLYNFRCKVTSFWMKCNLIVVGQRTCMLETWESGEDPYTVFRISCVKHKNLF